MKINNNLKVVCGTLVGIIVGGLTVVCANQTIQAIQNTKIKISLNGQVQEFKDETTGETQYPITYNDRTYLPLRNVANLVGAGIDYDNDSNTAFLSTMSQESKLNAKIKENEIIGKWDLINPRILDNNETFVFEEKGQVSLFLDDTTFLQGNYKLEYSGENIKIDFNKLIYDNNTLDINYSLYLKTCNSSRIKIVVADDLENKGKLNEEIENKLQALNKIGCIYEKSDIRSNSIKQLIGTWYLKEEYVQPNITKSYIPSQIRFNEKYATYIGPYNFSVDGGYTINGDIVEICFNTFSATSVDPQTIQVQTVKLRLINNSELVVIRGGEDVIYNYSSGKTIRDLVLREGFIFEKDQTTSPSSTNDYFVTNSVHATIPGVPGAYVGELYYFSDDGTYYWGASEYYNDQEKVAVIGTWEIKNNQLILNEDKMLYLTDGNLVGQSQPNGLSEKELVDYKETIYWGPNQIKYDLNYVGTSSYSSDISEYTINGKTWYSNTSFDMDDNPWIKKIKEYTKKYPFLGGSYANEAKDEYSYNKYLIFENTNEFYINAYYDNNKEKYLTVYGTYEVNGNEVICNISKCITYNYPKSDWNIEGKLVLNWQNDNFKVLSWEYKTTESPQTFLPLFFSTNFVEKGDSFNLAQI